MTSAEWTENAIREAIEATRQEAYAALCARCANGDVPVFTTYREHAPQYMHFGTVPCPATELRKRWEEGK